MSTLTHNEHNDLFEAAIRAEWQEFFKTPRGLEVLKRAAEGRRGLERLAEGLRKRAEEASEGE